MEREPEAQATRKTAIGPSEGPFERIGRSRLGRSLINAKPALAALVILSFITLVGFTAPFLAPHEPDRVSVELRLLPPYWQEGGSARYPLGTDSLGRDILSRLIYGARVSLLVGFSAVLVSGFLGIALGLVSGFYGGRADDLIMGFADIQLAFPFILLAITIMAVLGAGLMNIILVLGIARWVSYGRVVRGQVMATRELEFVEAARAIGQKNFRIMVVQILPNIMAPVIVIGSFAVAGNIISEASLSFLGLGIPPSIPTWGGMLAEGREYLRRAWWLATFPGLSIMVTVLSINLLGDWLRDYLDPRISKED